MSLKKEYMKERKRIQSYLSKQRKFGLEFSKNILPKIPKRITEGSIRRLQKITPQKIQEKAVFVDKDTGEVIEGKISKKYAKEFNKQHHEYYPNETDIVLNNFADNVSHFEPMSMYSISNFKTMVARFPNSAEPIITPWINNLISEYGADNVAQMLQDAMADGLMLTFEIAYDNSLLQNYMADLVDYLPEVGNFTKDEILDKMSETFENMSTDYDI